MNIAPLLLLIRNHEAPKGYNQIWGGIKKEDYPSREITTMSIKGVLDWQDSIDKKYRSEACGGYQFLEDTLRDIYKPAGFNDNTIFTSKIQDNLAIFLLRKRGLAKYVEGKISAETFANNIAKEWASFPVVTGINKGRSFYAGDGLNKALVSVDEVMHAIKLINGENELLVTTVVTKTPIDNPKILTGIAAIIAAILVYLGLR